MRKSVKHADLLYKLRSLITSDLQKHSSKSLKSDVLLLDDCDLQRLVISGLLKELGLSSTCVDSISAAIPYLAFLTQDKLIISDIELAGGSGFEFIKLVRTHHKNIHIPSIAISSNSSYAVDAIKAGFDAFLAKPISKESLARVLTTFGFNVEPKKYFKLI